MQSSPTRPLVEEYANVESGQFGPRLERSWIALEQIKNQVTQLVEDESLSPLEGVGIVACASAQVFGYAAFHGQATPADLYTTLAQQTGKQR